MQSKYFSNLGSLPGVVWKNGGDDAKDEERTPLCALLVEVVPHRRSSSHRHLMTRSKMGHFLPPLRFDVLDHFTLLESEGRNEEQAAEKTDMSIKDKERRC